MEEYDKAFKDLEKALKQLNNSTIAFILDIGMEDTEMAHELVSLAEHIRGIRYDMDNHRDKVLKIKNN